MKKEDIEVGKSYVLVNPDIENSRIVSVVKIEENSELIVVNDGGLIDFHVYCNMLIHINDAKCCSVCESLDIQSHWWVHENSQKTIEPVYGKHNSVWCNKCKDFTRMKNLKD